MKKDIAKSFLFALGRKDYLLAVIMPINGQLRQMGVLKKGRKA